MSKKEQNTEVENQETLSNEEEMDYQAILEENAKLKDQLMYLAADTDNFRKRSAKQVEDAGKFAVNSFAKDLIDVLENLYLATKNVSQTTLEENEVVNSIFQGVEMTKINMLNVLSKYGIRRVFPENGEMFDHNFHEAVSYIEQPEFADNSIVNVMRAGYLLHDRLIKPAIVILAKNSK